MIQKDAIQAIKNAQGLIAKNRDNLSIMAFGELTRALNIIGNPEKAKSEKEKKNSAGRPKKKKPEKKEISENIPTELNELE